MRYIEDQVVVFDAHKLDKVKNILQKGDIILGLNGKSIEEIIKENLKTTSGSNINSKMRVLLNSQYFLSSYSEIVNITFKRDDKIYEEKIDLSENIKHGLTFNEINANYWKLHDNFKRSNEFYKYIDKGICYIDPMKIPTKTTEEIFNDIYENSNGLIIDLQCYPKKFDFYDYLKERLVDKKTLTFYVSSPSITTKGVFEYSEIYDIPKAKAKFYNKKIIILVNENTHSAAETMAMVLSSSSNCIILGSQTSGANGNVVYLPLPGGVEVRYSGLGVYYPDGSCMQRVGVRLDEVVKPTIKGIIEGRDEQLERAIEIIKEGKKM